jgi:hypothetical protein
MLGPRSAEDVSACEAFLLSVFASDERFKTRTLASVTEVMPVGYGILPNSRLLF